jgi:hypothetical protein
MMKNVTVTFSIAAALGALTTGAVASGSLVITAVTGAAVLVAAEGLKKSKAFAALSAAVTEGINEASHGEVWRSLKELRERFRSQLNFFLLTETILKRLAGRHSEFKWLTKTSQWLRQQVGTQPWADLRDEQYPHQVWILIPEPGGVEPPALYRVMDRFCTERALHHMVRSNQGGGVPALRYCFEDVADADVFHKRFGGERVTIEKRR